MNQGTLAYTELLRHTRPDTQDTFPYSIRAAAHTLLTHANERGALSCSGPWRLHPDEANALDLLHGSTPPGGWHSLAGLLAGTPWLVLLREGFVATIPADGFDAWSDEHVQCTLIEALTCRLVPPKTAAGLFLHIGLHPAWGLRLAHKAQHWDEELHGREHDESFYRNTFNNTFNNKNTLDVIAFGVFGIIALLLETLRSLEPHTRYKLEHFAHLVHHACLWGKTCINIRASHMDHVHTPLFFDEVLSKSTDMARRALDFTLVDLVDAFFVPTGIMQRYNDHTFSVAPERIPGDCQIMTQGHLNTCSFLMCFLSTKHTHTPCAHTMCTWHCFNNS